MQKILVSTTQRCGSTWVSSIACHLMEQDHGAVYVEGNSFGLMNFIEFGNHDNKKVTDFSDFLMLRNAESSVFKTHDLPSQHTTEFLNQNLNFVVINVQRDFRDVLISRLMYNRHHLPSVGRKIESQFVENNQHLSDRDLVQEFLFTQEYTNWQVEWKLYTGEIYHPRYLKLDYENMLTDEGLLYAIRAIEALAVADKEGAEKRHDRAEVIFDLVKFSNFGLNKKKDRAEREVKSEFCRKGVAGDYINYLTERQAEKIKIIMT